jgi:hypothetical protein
MKFGRKILPKANRELIIQRDGGVCHYCGSDEQLEVDHVIPLSKKGDNAARNLVSCCLTCNRIKNGNRLLPFHEEITLEYVRTANIAAGIEGDSDMSLIHPSAKKKRGRPTGYSPPRKSDEFPKRATICPKGNRTGPVMTREERVKKKRWEEIESKLLILFRENQSIYIFTTETRDETQKAIYRTKARRDEYISVPTNKQGGRTIVLSSPDKIGNAKKVSLEYAKKILSESIVPTKYGNISGSYGLSTYRC